MVEALSGRANSSSSGDQQQQRVRASLARLNAELLDITQLYSDFAEPYELWECQLAILHCAGYDDPMLVENVWENIIELELGRGENLPAGSRVTMMANKVKALAKVYANSQKYFPLGKRTECLSRSIEFISVT